MKPMNIYLCGVGGQGIGLLSEIMIQSCLKAGYTVKGVDTHGLAQRGGIVFSNIRLGEGVHTPMIAPGEADLILGLERLEAYRGVVSMLREGGSVVYYDCEYQPIHVRMGKAKYPAVEDLSEAVAKRHGHVQRVHIEELPDARMQNVALLGRVATMGVIDGLTPQIVEQSLREVLPAAVIEANLIVLHRAAVKTQAG
jgi:indolepyruvate ferredoxin oxidoreductase beta subunit